VLLIYTGTWESETQLVFTLTHPPECVKRLRQLGREFRVEVNCLDRRSRLLSGA
jgi:hypothetical protein